MDKEQFQEFINLNILEHHFTHILGSDNFTEPLKNINENIKILLDDCAKIIIENESSIPSLLTKLIEENINRVKNYLTTIKALADKWQTGNRVSLIQEKNNLFQDMNKYVSGIYFQRTDQGIVNNNFLTAVSLIRTFDKRSQNILNDYNAKKADINIELTNLKTKESDYDGKISEANKILENLRTDASKKVVYDYSNIFLEEAEKHSHITKGAKENKYGVAEKWLITGLISSFVLLVFIIAMYFVFPVKDKSDLDYQLLITKISIISILVFLITFSFKQYSINKHLHTLNKHRENVLNSYQLFLKSISDDESNIRNILMLEVAKAIYEQGKTGFINERDGESGSPSIIEFAKFLPKDKNPIQ